VYVVAEIQAGMAHDPPVWLGRMVRVRGIVERCLLWFVGQYSEPCLDRCPVPHATSRAGRPFSSMKL
jgi:hypothetical protein